MHFVLEIPLTFASKSAKSAKPPPPDEEKGSLEGVPNGSD